MFFVGLGWECSLLLFWWWTISLWHARRRGLVVRPFVAAGIGFWVPGLMVAMGVSWRIRQVCCFLLVVLVAADIVMIHAFTGTYGINYGRLANNIPSPDRVVTLLKSAKIKNVRIYDVDRSVLRAFRGSGLELEVVVPNEILVNMSSSTDHASNWVRQNIEPYLPDTDIRGIAVGNEILAIENEDTQGALVGAVKNIYNAIERLHLKNKIVIWTPHSQAVFQNSFPPSSCTFKASVLPYMRPLLQFFSQIGSPFYVNVYPFLSYKSNPKDIDINYALFKPNAGIHDAKTKLHYDNMFDAQIDAAYAALEAAGFGHMEIHVSETGWASRGDEDEPGATVENARTFNFNLRKRLALRKGTPFRPKIVIKAYVFALFNENQKPGPTSERNFGLYKPDGTIAYDIGFPGLKSSSTSSLPSGKDTGAGGWRHYSFALTICMTMLIAHLS